MALADSGYLDGDANELIRVLCHINYTVKKYLGNVLIAVQLYILSSSDKNKHPADVKTDIQNLFPFIIRKKEYSFRIACISLIY